MESIEFLQEDTLREGEIISRTLRLSNKPSSYVYLRSRSELEAFAREFGSSQHRYLHISCHGGDKGFYTTTDSIPAAELAETLARHVGDRRVFVSACLAAESPFARTLLKKQPRCLSVVAPVGTIGFDDAAIFWTAFYHLTFKKNSKAMNNGTIEQIVGQCAELVGEKFRFFHMDGLGRIKEKTLG
jgi:hypothetical protein